MELLGMIGENFVLQGTENAIHFLLAFQGKYNEAMFVKDAYYTFFC